MKYTFSVPRNTIPCVVHQTELKNIRIFYRMGKKSGQTQHIDGLLKVFILVMLKYLIKGERTRLKLGVNNGNNLSVILDWCKSCTSFLKIWIL